MKYKVELQGIFQISHLKFLILIRSKIPSQKPLARKHK